MLLHEEFTRCKCGAASLKKETIVLANYKKNNNSVVQFTELPGRAETHYKCVKCDALVFKVKE